ERLAREALRIREASLPPSDPDIGRAVNLVAVALQEAQRLDEAERYYKRGAIKSGPPRSCGWRRATTRSSSRVSRTISRRSIRRKRTTRRRWSFTENRSACGAGGLVRPTRPRCRWS